MLRPGTLTDPETAETRGQALPPTPRCHWGEGTSGLSKSMTQDSQEGALELELPVRCHRGLGTERHHVQRPALGSRFINGHDLYWVLI